MKKVLFKRIISTMVTIAMLITMVPATFASVEQFVDFPTGWSKEAMTFSVDNGLINGKSATKIEPRANLTRAEMATIINRAFGAEVTCDISQYTDVKTNDWFYTEMQKAVNMQTFQGDGDGTLRPNDSITREEVMTVIARAIVLESNDYSSINKFSDSSSISSWAKPFVSALIAGGYVDGYEDGTVRPGAKITREEFAQLMYNIFKTYITVSGTYNSVTNSDCVMINEGGVTLSDVTIDGDLVLGDGVSTDKIFLTNVTIKGRLVARGGVITLKNVTTGGGVVVKNVNGVTHFNNYKTETVFKGVIEHTRTTYLRRGSGSSSGETTVAVTINHPNEGQKTIELEKGETVKDAFDKAEYTMDSFFVVDSNLYTVKWYIDDADVVSGSKIDKSCTITYKLYGEVKFWHNGKVLDEKLFLADSKTYEYKITSLATPPVEEGFLGWFDTNGTEYEVGDVTKISPLNLATDYELGDEVFDIEFYMYPENTAGCVLLGKLEGVQENSTVGYDTDNKTVSIKVKNIYRNAKPGRELWDPSVPTEIGVMYNHVEQGYIDGDYIHYIYPDLVYKDANGDWQTFTGSTFITSDMKVYAVKKYAAITLDGKLGDYVDFGSLKPVLRTPYSSTTRAMDSLKDALYLSRNSFAQILTKETEEKLYAKIAPKAKIIDNNGYILIKDYNLKISDVIAVSDVEKEIRNHIINILKNGTDAEIKELVEMIHIDTMIDSIGISALAKIIGYDVTRDEILKLENRDMLVEYIQSSLALDNSTPRNTLIANSAFIESILENDAIKAKFIDAIIENPDIAISVIESSASNKATFIDGAVENAQFINALLDNDVFKAKVISLIHNQDKEALIKLIDEDILVRNTIISELRRYDTTHNHAIEKYLEGDILFKEKIIDTINDKSNYKAIVTALKEYSYFKDAATERIKNKLNVDITDAQYNSYMTGYDADVVDADGINAEISAYIKDILDAYNPSETTGINVDINTYMNKIIDDYIENGDKDVVEFETQIDKCVVVVVTEYLENQIQDKDVIEIIDEIIINYIKKHINLSEEEWVQIGDDKLKTFITDLKQHFINEVKNTEFNDNLKSVIKGFITDSANKTVVTDLLTEYYAPISEYILANAVSDTTVNTQIHSIIKSEAKTDSTKTLISDYITNNFDYVRNDLLTDALIEEYIESEQNNTKLINLVKKKVTTDTIVKYVFDVRSDAVKLDEFVSKALEMIKKLDYYKKFINSFKRKDGVYNINKDNIHFMIAVAQAIYEYDVDGALGLLNNATINNMIDKVPQIKNTIDELFTSAKEDFLSGVEEIADKLDSDQTYSEDYKMSLGMRINIAKMLEMYYDKLQSELIERVEAKAPYYYNNNQYLREFVSINVFDMMIDYDSSKDESAIGGDNSGYHIRPFMEYYDTLYNNLLLFDKAVLWYGGHGHTPPITEGELKAIREDILADIVKAIDKLQSFLEDLDSGNEVVGGYTIDDIIDKVESLKNLSASSVNGMTSQITAMIDNICTILEKIDGGNVVAGGYTMDELAALCDKLEFAVEKLSDEDYEYINKKLSSAINKVATKADEIIKELDATGTILGKVSLDELFAKVDFINNIYLKYEDKIDSLIAKLASADIGGIGGSVEDNVNSEYWEDIIFGNDEYNRFNLDTIFDFVAPHLDDIRVDNPDNWYDKMADGYIRFVIDEYRIAPKDASITIDRYFQ